MPELSIIMPNYNNAQYLDDCIQSIVEQTYSDFELIISDDNSSDNSVAIINKWIETHPEIRLLQQDKNMGVSKNRHKAILQARGTYITTLDSDDVYLHPGKLEKEMELIAFHKSETGIDVCAFSNVVIVDKDLNTVGFQWSEDKIKEGQILNDIISRSSMIPRDFIFLKSDYLALGGYDPNFNLYEDWDLKIRLAGIREFYFTGISGIGYRRKGEGLSYVPLNKHIVALKKIFRKNLPLIEEADSEEVMLKFNGQLRELKEKLLKSFYTQKGIYLENKSFIKAFWQDIKKIYYKNFF